MIELWNVTAKGGVEIGAGYVVLVNTRITSLLKMWPSFGSTLYADINNSFVSSSVIDMHVDHLMIMSSIFVNNTLKTLLAILLGVLFGIIPAFFLLANGIGLGVAWSLSVSARGPWLSLLSLLPHGILELPAVLLGTSIGLAIGIQALKRLTGKTDRKIGAELASGLRYFCSVILPLLFVAALVEAFVTAALVAPR